MSIILYALTQDGYFCKTQEASKLYKEDWMKVPLDRKLFNFLTTLFKETTILTGKLTYNILPQKMFQDNRQIILLSSQTLSLKTALIHYPNSIIIGGHQILLYFNQKKYLNHIHTIITITLPITINSHDNKNNYLRDPLKSLKPTLKKSHTFTLTEKNINIVLDSWHPYPH